MHYNIYRQISYNKAANIMLTDFKAEVCFGDRIKTIVIADCCRSQSFVLSTLLLFKEH